MVPRCLLLSENVVSRRRRVHHKRLAKHIACNDNIQIVTLTTTMLSATFITYIRYYSTSTIDPATLLLLLPPLVLLLILLLLLLLLLLLFYYSTHTIKTTTSTTVTTDIITAMLIAIIAISNPTLLLFSILLPMLLMQKKLIIIQLLLRINIVTDLEKNYTYTTNTAGIKVATNSTTKLITKTLHDCT